MTSTTARRPVVIVAGLVLLGGIAVITTSMVGFIVTFVLIPWGHVAHVKPPGVLLGSLDLPAFIAVTTSVACLALARLGAFGGNRG